MIGLKDLPKDTYISFGKLIYDNKGNLIDIKGYHEFLKNLMKDFQKVAKDVKFVSSEIGIPRCLVYKILACKRKIRLEYLLKICEYLKKNNFDKYSIKFLEENIYSISCCRGGMIIPYIKEDSILKIRFPFDFKTPEAIKCLTFPFGDGYINIDYSGHIRVGYVNSDLTLHNEIISCMTKTFGNLDYSQRKVSGAYETFFTGIIGKIYVNCLEFQYGNKTKTNPSLPEHILTLKEPNLIGVCISQFLDDEGNLGPGGLSICQSAGKNFMSDKKPKDINPEKYTPLVLKQLSDLLKLINVNSFFRKPCTYYDRTLKKWKLTYYLMINGYDNFLRLLPFLRIKKKSLKGSINRRLQKFANIITKVEKIQKSKGYFNVNDIADSLDVSMESARNHIQTLNRANFLEVAGRGRYTRKKGKPIYIQTKFVLKIPNDLRESLSIY